MSRWTSRARLLRTRKRVERSSASSGAEMSKKATSRKTTAKKATAKKITARRAAPKRAATPKGKGPTEKKSRHLRFGAAPVVACPQAARGGYCSVVLARDNEARPPTARRRRRRALGRQQDLLHEQCERA